MNKWNEISVLFNRLGAHIEEQSRRDARIQFAQECLSRFLLINIYGMLGMAALYTAGALMQRVPELCGVSGNYLAALYTYAVAVLYISILQPLLLLSHNVRRQQLKRMAARSRRPLDRPSPPHHQTPAREECSCQAELNRFGRLLSKLPTGPLPPLSQAAFEELQRTLFSDPPETSGVSTPA
jgi:hypothetical protein